MPDDILSPPARLPDRHMAILRHAADGLTTGETAQAMHLSKSAVNKALIAIYALLGARGKAHAVALAYQLRLLVVPSQEGGPTHA